MTKQAIVSAIDELIARVTTPIGIFAGVDTKALFALDVLAELDARHGFVGVSR